MALLLAHKSNRPADALVMFSALQAGGFSPVFFHYHHGFMAIGYIEALGGFQIMLPQEEMHEAREFILTLTPLEDYDSIKPKPIRDVVQATILSTSPFFLLVFVSPAFLTILWALLIVLDVIYLNNRLTFSLAEHSYFACIIAILAHAKYVAVPRLRKSDGP